MLKCNSISHSWSNIRREVAVNTAGTENFQLWTLPSGSCEEASKSRMALMGTHLPEGLAVFFLLPSLANSNMPSDFTTY